MGAISPCTGLEITTTTACPLQSMIHFEALRASPQEELSSWTYTENVGCGAVVKSSESIGLVLRARKSAHLS